MRPTFPLAPAPSSNFTLRQSRYITVSIVTRVREGRSEIRIPAEGKYVLLQNVQTGPGAHPAHSMGTIAFILGVKRPGRDVIHSQLAPRLIKRAAKPLLLLHAYGKWTLTTSYWPVWPNSVLHKEPAESVRNMGFSRCWNFIWYICVASEDRRLQGRNAVWSEGI